MVYKYIHPYGKCVLCNISLISFFNWKKLQYNMHLFVLTFWLCGLIWFMKIPVFERHAEVCKDS